MKVRDWRSDHTFLLGLLGVIVQPLQSQREGGEQYLVMTVGVVIFFTVHYTGKQNTELLNVLHRRVKIITFIILVADSAIVFHEVADIQSSKHSKHIN